MSQVNLGGFAHIAVSYYKSEEFKSPEEAVFGQKHPSFKGTLFGELVEGFKLIGDLAP